MNTPSPIAARWTDHLQAALPGLLDALPVLLPAVPHGSMLLHGSTTRGIDDAHSDLDVWVLLPQAQVAAITAAAGTSFFGFTLRGKTGHFTLEARETFARRVERCDCECLAELRLATVLHDPDGWAADLLARACLPMPDAVRRAWFCYHYVEMRGDHRACDNPLERGDALALLQATVPALNHALRAALILERQPYPYIKWLGAAAKQTATGALVHQEAITLLDHLAAGALRTAGPEAAHPVSQRLRAIRQILITAARNHGLDAPWLNQWWLHIPQARQGIEHVRWSDDNRSTVDTELT